MATRLTDIEAKVLKLRLKDRVRLAERILASLDSEPDGDVEKLWLEEAERRLDRIEAGKAKLVPASKVMRKVRSLIR